MTKQRPVFVSAASFLAPGITGREELLAAYALAPTPPVPGKSNSFDGLLDTVEYEWNIDPAHPACPAPKDLKMLRRDVIAAAVCVGELLTKARIDEAARHDLPLYVATGFCMDNLREIIGRMTHGHLRQTANEPIAQRNIRLYEATHPLFALRALSNAVESFVAQAHAVHGDNTTYGNTSHSGFYAMEEGAARIASGQIDIALVGAANDCGPLSSLAYSNFEPYDGARHSSDCVAFLLLESEQGMRRREIEPLAELKRFASPAFVPSLTADETMVPLAAFPADPEAGLAILSAGISRHGHVMEKDEAVALWPAVFSWYESLGNQGASSFLFGVATALSLIASGQQRVVDCVNRDPYGRLAGVSVHGVKR